MDEIRVTVWNEFRHEQRPGRVRDIYPDGIHAVIAEAVRGQGMQVQTATLDQPEHGMTAKVLAKTDVLIWWGHLAHAEVRDEIVERIRKRVLAGMGLVVLHSGHHSKIFKELMGTSCSLRWREADEKERLWVLEPGHPIAAGVGPYLELPEHEMYGEHFDIPAPDTLVFMSWFKGGEVFRSGCCFRRGNGKIFYFSPGHETYPIYHRPEIQRVIINAVRWAAPTDGPDYLYSDGETLNIKEPLEALD